MTDDDFTTAARAEAESWIGMDLDDHDNFVSGAEWARAYLAEQEPTDAEVEAAAEAWEAHTLAEFHEDEGEMCCRECGEAFDWMPLDGVRFNARRRSHRFRAALFAARAARRDEEKQDG